jgi:hypothetical protein
VNELISSLSGFDNVEVGILWSGPEKEGRSRYPGVQWLRQLRCAWLNRREANLTLSLHLCGRAARAVTKGGFTDIDAILARLTFPDSTIYGRVQVNCALGPHSGKLDTAAIRPMARKLRREGRSMVLQVKNPLPWVHENAESCLGLWGDVLIDASGGRGILPDEWPAPIPWLACSYAGGLTPENVGAALCKMARPWMADERAVPRAGPGAEREAAFFGIDAETGLRSPPEREGEDGAFSIEQARRFIERAEAEGRRLRLAA